MKIEIKLVLVFSQVNVTLKHIIEIMNFNKNLLIIDLMLVFKQVKSITTTGLKSFWEFKTNSFLFLITSLFISFLASYIFYYYTGKTEYIVYFFLANLISLRLRGDLSDLIKSGNLDKFLVFPVNIFLLRYFYTLPKRLLEYLIKLIVVFVVAFIFNTDIYWLDLFIFIIIADFFAFLFSFVVQELAFFFFEVHWIQDLISIVYEVLSGKLIPLSVLPINFKTILEHSFFPIASFFVFKVATEGLSSFILKISFIWVFIFSVLAVIFWKIGLKKYEVQFN